MMMHLGRIKVSLFHTLTVAVLVVSLLPSSLHSYDEMTNITNVIDRRRSLNGPSYEDQSVDDYSSAQSEGGGSCGSCRMRDEVRTRSLENIKEQILLRLGMQNAPNTTGRKLPQVPQDVIAQYPNLAIPGMLGDQPQPSFKPGQSIIEEEDTLHIKTEKVMVFSKPCPKLRHSWRGQGIQYFQFSDKITRHRVKLATLYVWVRGSGEDRPSNADIQIKVYKVLRDNMRPESPVLVQKSQASVRQSVGEGRWIKMDTTVMVSEWFKNTKENLGFVVNATLLNGQKVVVSDNTVEGGTHMPFVDIETSDGRRRRTKRTVGLNCNEDTEETLCCRYPLTVDFEEFGWEFIIAPKRYEANYCAGECPFITFQKYAHTHLVKMTNPSTTGPCCAPRKMSAISMLYFDQELNVIYGSLPGMVVDRCGCS